jgi:hypothetical protein
MWAVDCSETRSQVLDRESHTTSCQRHECRLDASFDSTSVSIVALGHYAGDRAICLEAKFDYTRRMMEPMMIP